MVSRTIHQTWKDKNIPDHFLPWIKSWKDTHPDWEYKLWTDDDNRRLIKEKYEWFLPTYDNYEFNIQRADAIRCFILYEYGGLYADVDIWCAKDTSPLFSDVTDCALFYENPNHCLKDRFLNTDIFTNSIMYSVKGSKFMLKLMKTMSKNEYMYEPFDNDAKETTDENLRVIYSTGPGFITTMYYRYNSLIDGISPISHRCFEYCTQAERYTKLDNSDYDIPDDGYGIHWMVNTWLTGRNANSKYKFK